MAYDIYTRGKIKARFDVVVSAYLGAPVVADVDRIVDEVEPANGTLTVIAQPDVPRNLTLTTVDVNASLTAGTVTVVGTDPQGRAITEAFAIATAGTKAGTKSFAKVTSATLAGKTGTSTGDTIALGVGNVIGLPSDILNTSAVKTVYANAAPVTPAAVAVGTSTSGVDCNAITYDGSKSITVFYNVGS